MISLIKLVVISSSPTDRLLLQKARVDLLGKKSGKTNR